MKENPKFGKEKVFIVRADDPVELGFRAMEALKPKIEGRVFIKSNITVPELPETGIITHPQVVEGIIKYLRNLDKVTEIAIGDGGGETPDMESYFQKCGYHDLAERYGIKLINLNADEAVILQISNGERLKEVKIAKSILDCDYLIDIPTLKTHQLAIVTLGMKNLMGCILPYNEKREAIHPVFERIHERVGDRKFTQEEFAEASIDFATRLCDFVTALVIKDKPNLVIIDGFVGRDGTGFADKGETKNMRLVLAGENVVAVDTVGAQIMGFDPRKDIPHLKLAAERGLGSNDLTKIEIIGEDPVRVGKKFRVIIFTG